MSISTSIECVLFDLDGTLIDTLPDFKVVLDQLLQENHKPAIDRNLVHQTVSDGARALVKLGFAIEESHVDFSKLHQRLLELYYQQLSATTSSLYPGLSELLDKFEAAQIDWGIVTNKPEKYCIRLLENLQLLERCPVLICPEHVAKTKPNPEALLLACQKLDCNIERTIYIGDHLRDMQAAKNADIIAVAAGYGYLSKDAVIEEWNADFILRSSEQTEALLSMLKFA